MNTSRRIVRQDNSILHHETMGAKNSKKAKEPAPKRAKKSPDLEAAHSETSGVTSTSSEQPPENTRVFHAQSQQPTWGDTPAGHIYQLVKVFVAVLILIGVSIAIVELVKLLVLSFWLGGIQVIITCTSYKHSCC